MINETADRVWGAWLSIVSPIWLIDRLLDTIEDMRGVLMPAQVCGLSCSELPCETDLDPIGA
jgi:hypothetical protein